MQKRVQSKTAQITVFIIIGLLLALIAFLMIHFSTKVKMGQLEQAQESVIGKIFQKEGLRLYVEDCLIDELERGLLLIGNQSRIWQEQGGRELFSPGINGMETALGNISYAIARKDYLGDDNKYPCLTGNATAYCKYAYPNSSILPSYPIKFGEVRLDQKAIEDDLESFLTARTIFCVENFTKNNISKAAEISTKDLSISLVLLGDGLNVGVDYPLTISLAGEEFFHLTQFDFFYPSSFKRFLDAAVILPIKFDTDFVDFEYEPDTFLGDTFEHGCLDTEGNAVNCTKTLRKADYDGLQVSFTKDRLGDDDLFVFEVPSLPGREVVKNQGYKLQFLRQNRPPALDYISRDACEEDGYDYLVIHNEPGDMGNVLIVPSAKDPDEEEISFGADSLDFGLNVTDIFGQGIAYTVVNPPQGRHNISIYAVDEHQAKDAQIVRILVDRPMKVEITLDIPYQVYNRTGQLVPLKEVFPGGKSFIVSTEDPVFINVTLPGDSTTSFTANAALNYTSLTENFGYLLPKGVALQEQGGCFALPWTDQGKRCDLNSYTPKELLEWKDMLKPGVNFSHFINETRKPGMTYAGKGIFNLSYEITYCGKNNHSDSAVIELEVMQCIPHLDPSIPYPYIPTDKETHWKWTYGLKADGTTDFDNLLSKNGNSNPFLASHACCSDFDLLPTGTDCFVNPELGCYVGTIETGQKDKGWILFEQYAVCDGERGNLCGEKSGIQYRLPNGQLLCGNSSLPGCNKNIPVECQEKEAGSIIPGGGWCYGNSGCERFCNREIVYKFGQYNFNTHTGNYPESLFKCGCESGDLGSLTQHGKSCLRLSDNKKGICQEEVDSLGFSSFVCS